MQTSSAKAVLVMKKLKMNFDTDEKCMKAITALTVKFYNWVVRDGDDTEQLKGRQHQLSVAIETMDIDKSIDTSDKILERADKLVNLAFNG